MKLICPCCRAVVSIEAWANEPAVLEAFRLMVRLPGVVQPRVFAYLGLFRTEKRGLAWPRVAKLLGELEGLVAAGAVQWRNSEARPAPPQVWVEALDAVIAARPTDLKDHAYLKKTAWEKAQPLAVEAEERRRIEARRRMQGPELPERLAEPADRDPRALEVLKSFTKNFKGGGGNE